MLESESLEEQKIEKWTEEILSACKGYRRISPPAKEQNQKEIIQNTRVILSDLLGKILSNGDSPYHHKEIDYNIFLLIQLEILSQVLHCERKMWDLRRKYKKSSLVEPLKQRHSMLKLLGSTIAWILLEFDTPYIRNLSRGHNQGYLVGKKGIIGEFYSLLKFHEPKKNVTVVLHGITHCLRVGDVTITNGQYRAPVEIKLVTSNTHRPDRRERRQLKKLQMLKEFFEKKESNRLIPGLKAIRFQSHKRDIHNWKSLSNVARLALSKGHMVVFPERGIAYGVCQKISQIEDLVLEIKKRWKEPFGVAGTLDRQILGLPEVMPFTLFEIPRHIKESILFGDLIVAMFVDLKAVCETFEDFDLKAWLDDGKLKVRKDGETIEIGDPPLDRLVYECLSPITLCRYIRDIPVEKLVKNKI